MGLASLTPGTFRLAIEGIVGDGSSGDIAIDEPTIFARDCSMVDEYLWAQGVSTLLDMIMDNSNGLFPDDIGHWPGDGNYTVKDLLCMEHDDADEMMDRDGDDMGGDMSGEMGGMSGGMGGMSGEMGGDKYGMGGDKGGDDRKGDRYDICKPMGDMDKMDKDMDKMEGDDKDMGMGMDQPCEDDMMPMMFPMDYYGMHHHMMSQKELLDMQDMMLHHVYEDKMKIEKKCMMKEMPKSKECKNSDVTGRYLFWKKTSILWIRYFKPISLKG